MRSDTTTRSSGQRIEQLLDASAAAGPAAAERAEELLRVVVDLYGNGLRRVLEIVDEAGALTPDVLDRLAADDLVSGLLLVHDLHPCDVEERVARALDTVRPYLGSHGGDAELLGVVEEAEGVVARLRLLGSCDGCPSSPVTLKLAVEDAVVAAAPEVVRIDVDVAGADAAVAAAAVAAAPKPAGGATVIPLDTLTARLHPPATPPLDLGGATVWEAVEEVSALRAGGVRTLLVANVGVVVTRVAAGLYAYRDVCPGCGSGFAGALVERGHGPGPATAVLTCPRCRAHFDVRRAGAGIGVDLRLVPLPLLERDGLVEVAVPGQPAGAPA
ncbi:MAG: NifU family protein [Kineosporiaceae bacterium]